MRYLSVCSGIGADHAAWGPLGWECVGFAETNPFAASVLATRFPGVPNFGDFTRINGDEYEGPVDLVCGGTPCQSFSVAGLRKGMDDARGNLSLEFCRLVGRIRPKWVVWENVPGVLSSNGGRDFGSIVGALVEFGYGVCWRVLDAQYVRVESHPRAVPQRRRRVWLVGSFGDWRPSAGVCFEPEGLRGHPPPRRQAGAETPAVSPGRAASEVGVRVCDVAPTLKMRADGAGDLGHNDEEAEGLVVAPSLAVRGDVSRALVLDGCHASEDGTGRGTPVVAVQERASTGDGCGPAGTGFRSDGAAYTIESRNTPQAVALDARQNAVLLYGEKVGPIDCSGHSMAVAGCEMVRRLTPVECERLQGFGDGHTDVLHNGRRMSNSARYRLLGNAWAVNCARWIGERIALWEEVAG